MGLGGGRIEGCVQRGIPVCEDVVLQIVHQSEGEIVRGLLGRF